MVLASWQHLRLQPMPRCSLSPSSWTFSDTFALRCCCGYKVLSSLLDLPVFPGFQPKHQLVSTSSFGCHTGILPPAPGLPSLLAGPLLATTSLSFQGPKTCVSISVPLLFPQTTWASDLAIQPLRWHPVLPSLSMPAETSLLRGVLHFF